MASVTIRKLEKELKSKIRDQAKANGHSMEEEIRCILTSVLDQKSTESAQSIENIPSNLSLEERLIELEKRGLWTKAKTPKKPFTAGEPVPGALERFLSER